MNKEVPIWEKSNLTLAEAASYYNIGINKLRELSEDESCKFVLWCGSKNVRRIFGKCVFGVDKVVDREKKRSYNLFEYVLLVARKDEIYD